MTSSICIGGFLCITTVDLYGLTKKCIRTLWFTVDKMEIFELIFNLSAYHHPENIDLPAGYKPPTLAITNLYWKVNTMSPHFSRISSTALFGAGVLQFEDSDRIFRIQTSISWKKWNINNGKDLFTWVASLTCLATLDKKTIPFVFWSWEITRSQEPNLTLHHSIHFNLINAIFDFLRNSKNNCG